MNAKIPSIATLKLITDRLSENKISFALGGSGLLFALGIGEEVNDWDITTEESLEKITEALKDLKWELIPNSELFKSKYLIKITHDNIELDIIGSFCIKKSDGLIHPVKLKISNYWNNIPLADPYEWMLAYRYMKREEKALKLENYLMELNKNK